MAKNQIETKITEHVEGKVKDLVETASKETSWYKKLGYYVAAAVGAVVVFTVQNFGPQIWETVMNTVQGMF